MVAPQQPFPRVAYIGRDQQIALLQKWTKVATTSNGCYILYFEADGGLGKTWLLNSYPYLFTSAFPQIRIARVVDFYDFVSRTPDGIEHKLIDGLKQIHNESYRIPVEQINAAFEQYNQVYIGYTSIREGGGSSSGQSEFTSERLRQAFIMCWNTLASTYPLVMSFDTVEALYGVRAPEEALVRVAEANTGYAQVLAWMEEVLPKLQHTLILFSGREGGRSFVERLLSLDLLSAPAQTLPPLTNLQDVQAYLQAYDVTLPSDELMRVLTITEGRPLLLTCFAETRRSLIALPPLPLPDKAQTRQAFEAELVETILNPLQRQDLAESTLIYCLYFLSIARRGLRRQHLRELFEDLGCARDDRVIEHLDRVALVKVTQLERSMYISAETNANPSDDQPDEILLLHDEIHRLIDESGMAGELALHDDALDFLANLSKQQVREERSASPAALLKAMTDHLYYEMTRDIVSGYRAYAVYIDWLLSENVVDEALVISEAFWSTLYYRVQRNGQEVQPYLEALQQAAPVLNYAQIACDEQVNRVQLLLARGQNTDAVTRAEELYGRYAREGVILAEEQPIHAGTLPDDQYLFVELSIWWALAIHFSGATVGSKRAENLLSRTITFLETPAWIQEEFLQLRRLFFLGHAYLYRGYLRRQQQRYAEAIADYEQGRVAFRDYRDHAIDFHGQHITPESLLNDHITNDLAQVTNNLAFSLALTGNLKRGRRLSDEVIKQYVPLSSKYQKALFYNTNALICMKVGDLEAAEHSVKRAEQLAHESGSWRARGLVSQARGLLERAKMMRQSEPDPGIEGYFQEAAQFLKDEPDSLREVYYDWADVLRDIVWLYRSTNRFDEARKYEQKLLNLLDQALTLLPERVVMQHAGLLESKAVMYRIMEEYENARDLLLQAEQIMRIDMPEYGQVVSGKIALQRGLIMLYADHDAESALRYMAIALARAYVFAPEHQDQASFERVIKQHIKAIPVEALRTFKRVTESELLYVLADDLPYQKPDSSKWADAWEDSISYMNNIINEYYL